MVSKQIIWALLILSFLIYFIISWVYKRLRVTNLQQALLVRNGLRLLNLKHSLGIALFGILFYLLVPELRYLIHIIEIPKLYVLLPFIGLLLAAAYISHISVQNHIVQEIVLSDYKTSEAWFYFLIRFTFLFAYEFYFRGILFYTLLSFKSMASAIVFSTLAYLIIHIFDSKKEIIGTIPFGIILCLITYLTNSIWYAFLLHLALSAVYEISIFYYQTIKTKRL